MYTNEGELEFDEDEMAVGYVGSNVRPSRPVGDAPSLCLQGRNDHTLQPIPGTDSKGKGLIRDCAVCSNTPLAGSSKGAHHRSSYEWCECKKALCIYPCFKRFHTLAMFKAECKDAFHSLPQVPVGSGVQEIRPAAKRGQRSGCLGTRHPDLGILPPTPQ